MRGIAGRWKNCAGAKGRWKNNLITKVAKAGVAFDNAGISPVVRYTLCLIFYSVIFFTKIYYALSMNCSYLMFVSLFFFFFYRQTLLHWAYELTREDYEKNAKKIK